MKMLALLALAFGYRGVCPSPIVPTEPHKPPPAPQSALIKSAVLARDYEDGKAVGVATTFKPTDTTLHCLVILNRATTLTARGAWYAVDAGGSHNYKFVEATLPRQLTDRLYFNASLPRPWPVGKYRVDIYINDKLARSIPYQIAE